MVDFLLDSCVCTENSNDLQTSLIWLTASIVLFCFHKTPWH